MSEFVIMEENFPSSEIEFERRFSSEQACYDYLFKMKWPEGSLRSPCLLDKRKAHLYLYPL